MNFLLLLLLNLRQDFLGLWILFIDQKVIVRDVSLMTIQLVLQYGLTLLFLLILLKNSCITTSSTNQPILAWSRNLLLLTLRYRWILLYWWISRIIVIVVYHVIWINYFLVHICIYHKLNSGNWLVLSALLTVSMWKTTFLWICVTFILNKRLLLKVEFLVILSINEILLWIMSLIKNIWVLLREVILNLKIRSNIWRCWTSSLAWVTSGLRKFVKI